jgi:hypothetical protein
MDPLELKIGNYVEVEGAIVKVVSISKNEEGSIEVRVSQGKPAGAIASEIKPVPLSRKVLVRHCHFDENMQLGIIIDKLHYYLKLENSYIVLYNNKEEPMIHFWDVRYLHQLQNLYFALKAKEMPVKF